MEVFRISRDIFANDLSASGVASRWNMDQQYVLYTGHSRSLATVELVVHRASIKPSFIYKIMVISISDDDHLYEHVKISDLPEDWRSTNAYPTLQKIGGAWYKSKSSLVLKVPSVIIPSEFNYIINTRHPDFSNHVQLVRLEEYYWDERLI